MIAASIEATQAQPDSLLGELTLARVRQAVGSVVVVGAYVGSAKLGLELSVAHGVITPVWPPTGIALAALILLGPRLWPAIALGAFVSNATSGVSIAVAAAIRIDDDGPGIPTPPNARSF